MARINVGEFLKKRLGSSSSRDPRVTWSGTFGTESSRKKQENRLAKQPSEVGVTARKRKMPVADAPKSSIGKAVTESVRASATAPKPAAKPKAAAKPKVDRMKGFMADLESINPDNAVLKKLRERGFAKGGSIDGCASKGKTKGKYI